MSDQNVQISSHLALSAVSLHGQGWAQIGEFSALAQRKNPKLDVMLHAYNLSIRRDEAFKANLGYIANLRRAWIT